MLHIKTKFPISILLGSLEHELKKIHLLLYNGKALCNKNGRTIDNKNKEQMLSGHSKREATDYTTPDSSHLILCWRENDRKAPNIRREQQLKVKGGFYNQQQQEPICSEMGKSILMAHKSEWIGHEWKINHKVVLTEAVYLLVYIWNFNIKLKKKNQTHST